jgi:hypothetical protein
MFGVKDIKELAQAIDRFNGLMERLVIAAEKLAAAHGTYVADSHEAMKAIATEQKEAE